MGETYSTAAAAPGVVAKEACYKALGLMEARLAGDNFFLA